MAPKKKQTPGQTPGSERFWLEHRAWFEASYGCKDTERLLPNAARIWWDTLYEWRKAEYERRAKKNPAIEEGRLVRPPGDRPALEGPEGLFARNAEAVQLPDAPPTPIPTPPPSVIEDGDGDSVSDWDSDDGALRVHFDTRGEEMWYPSIVVGKEMRWRNSTWTGIRLLGEGGFGSVSLWHLLDGKDTLQDRVVRKDMWVGRKSESASMWRDPLYWYDMEKRIPMEVKLHYRACQGSDFIIPYRGYHVDQKQRLIHIYLDVAPHGSLESLFTQSGNAEYQVYERDKDDRKRRLLPEPFLWFVFLALTEACLRLSYGREGPEVESSSSKGKGKRKRSPEGNNSRPSQRRRIEKDEDLDSDDESSKWKAIVHRDIKPANILLGKVDDREHASEHPAFPSYPKPMLTDFGIAVYEEPVNGDLQNPTDYREFGTPGMMAPEHRAWRSSPFRKKKWNRLGPHTNVWEIGAAMYRALQPNDVWPVRPGHKSEENPTMLHQDGKPDPTGRVLSSDKFGYMSELVKLIRRCLEFHPKSRPTLPELRKLIIENVQNKKMAEEDWGENSARYELKYEKDIAVVGTSTLQETLQQTDNVESELDTDSKQAKGSRPMVDRCGQDTGHKPDELPKSDEPPKPADVPGQGASSEIIDGGLRIDGVYRKLKPKETQPTMDILRTILKRFEVQYPKMNRREPLIDLYNKNVAGRREPGDEEEHLDEDVPENEHSADERQDPDGAGPLAEGAVDDDDDDDEDDEGPSRKKRKKEPKKTSTRKPAQPRKTRKKAVPPPTDRVMRTKK